jgi:hypothetical protein
MLGECKTCGNQVGIVNLIDGICNFCHSRKNITSNSNSDAKPIIGIDRTIILIFTILFLLLWAFMVPTFDREAAHFGWGFMPLIYTKSFCLINFTVSILISIFFINTKRHLIISITALISVIVWGYWAIVIYL